jgi:hypothetical protein
MGRRDAYATFSKHALRARAKISSDSEAQFKHHRGGDLEAQAMDEHQGEEGPEVARECQAQQGQPAEQLAEGEESFRREIPVGELVAEKHRHQRRHREGIEDGRLLPGRKPQAGQVTEDLRQPVPQMTNSRTIITKSLNRTAFIMGQERRVMAPASSRDKRCFAPAANLRLQVVGLSPRV